MIESACQNIGVVLKPVMELSTMESQLQMTAQQVGATVLPKSYADTTQLGDHITFIPFTEPSPRKNVGIVYRRDIYMDSTIQSFIQHLTK
ncbi:LysR substrate binding domain protein [compost metagenome]